MALMRPLQPAPEVSLPTAGWKLLATEAGRYATGLRATIQLWNADQQGIAQLALAHPEQWEAFVADVARRATCPAEAVTGALYQLTTAIEGALRQAEQQAERISQATGLVELAADLDLFHTSGADSEAYAIIPVEGHREVWPLKAKGFRRWLERKFHGEYGKVPGGQAVQDALGVLAGKALFDGEEHPVHTRLAIHDGRIYLDLGDAAWQAIEIAPTGWRVVADPPVRFRHVRGMQALPVPVSGGDLAPLRCLVNVTNDADWMLLVAWLVAALRPTGPYPVLVLHGEQGSAKSTTARILRALIDPNTAPLRAEPRDARDLIIAGTNGWVIALDNLSHLPPWLSDALCRLATGGGFATRELYSDAEETIFDAQRPVILNGIEELATRGDLLDRAIILYLPSIPDAERRPETDLWRDFEAQRPQILGALLDVVSKALANFHMVKLDKHPRMADFAVWVTAAEPGLGWEAGAFLNAYTANRQQANELALEAALIVPPLRDLLAAKGNAWQGTATELLHDLADQADERTRRAQGWPTNGRALSNTLRRVAPNLRAVGIDVTFHPGRRQGRRITVSAIPKELSGTFASRASSSSPSLENQPLTGDAHGDENVPGDGKSPSEDARGTQMPVPATPCPARRGTMGTQKNLSILTRRQRRK
ncbi:MAG: hypothetical protein HYZ81_23480 [Nitrospinae bacterium]|nr:hypothetical protein [Nitrospinota bacterium]